MEKFSVSLTVESECNRFNLDGPMPPLPLYLKFKTVLSAGTKADGTPPDNAETITPYGNTANGKDPLTPTPTTETTGQETSTQKLQASKTTLSGGKDSTTTTEAR